MTRVVAMLSARLSHPGGAWTGHPPHCSKQMSAKMGDDYFKRSRAMAVMAVTPVWMAGRRRGRTKRSVTREPRAVLVAFREFAGIGDAQPEHHAGNFAVEGEESNVFAAHDGFRTVRRGLGRMRRLRVCEGVQRAMDRLGSGVSSAALRWASDRKECRSLSKPIRRASNIGEDAVAQSGGVGGASGPLDFVRNDIVLRSAMNGADGQHGRLLRIDLAADDGLRNEHKFGRENNGIFPASGREPWPPIPRIVT